LTYATDTEYAARNLIELAMKEEAKLADAKQALAISQRQFELNRWDFRTSGQSDDFSDAYELAAHARMARSHQQVARLEQDAAELRLLVATHETAVQAICGAILQIAKQGISLVHGAPRNAPEGREVGPVSLRDVVWEGRNQAMHYDDSRPFNEPVKRVFRDLEGAYGETFSLTLHQGKSRAKQIIELLGWHTYDAYLLDAGILGLA